MNDKKVEVSLDDVISVLTLASDGRLDNVSNAGADAYFSLFTAVTNTGIGSTEVYELIEAARSVVFKPTE